MPAGLRRLYAPEFLVREDLKVGEIPSTGHVYSTAFGIAWASIVEMFLIALISMVDTVMVSSVGDHAVAAVGLVLQPRFIVQTLVLAINTAVTSITARRKGEDNRLGAESCLKQCLLLSAGASVVISLLVYPFAQPILRFVGAQSDSIAYATEYFQVLLIGIPFANISLTISAAQRGIGNTRASMLINMLANVVNMIFNYLLIGGNFGFPRLGVKGAAIATVIGWICGFVLAFVSVARRDHFLFLYSRENWRPDKTVMKSVYRVASGSFVEQLCMRIGFQMNSMVVANLGTMMYAAHIILLNILNLAFSFGEGYGIAASSLVGQNLGAKRPDMSIVYGKACHRISLLTSILLFVVLSTMGRPMIHLFTQSEDVIAVCTRIMTFVVIIIFGQSAQMIFMGSLRGAGDTRFTAVISMLSIMILRPILSWTLAYPLGFGLTGVWSGLMFDQYLRLLLTYIRFSGGRWTGIKL